jgi:hypothetical protein
MKKRSLLDSNPYLRDREKFRKSLITSVSSSTAIETGEPINKIEEKLTRSRSLAKRVKHA